MGLKLKGYCLSILLLMIAGHIMAQNMPKVTELSMKSVYFNHEREVLIYTPVNYNEFTATRYDVMYVFDSQERAKFDLVHSLRDLACPSDPDQNKHFIIVGICSPIYLDIEYYRNTDYLPMPIHAKDAPGNRGLFSYEPNYGRSADLKKFLKQELMPYIDKTYRTSGRNIGIGHSLSASFVLDCMITDDLFDDYIAMSPNYSYDEFRLVSDLEQYPFKNHQEPRFIFTSMGNERQMFGEYWHQGWLRASAFFSDESHFPKNTIVSVKNYPEYEHNQCYVPSLTEALNEYLQFSTSFLQQHLSEETYPIRIELTGASMKDDVYITGNQEALGNWDPKRVKMELVNDSTCAIDLQLHLPVYFKFTTGDWDHKIFPENADDGNLIIYNADEKVYNYRRHKE